MLIALPLVLIYVTSIILSISPSCPNITNVKLIQCTTLENFKSSHPQLKDTKFS